jgi:ATP-dependent DNA helicase RecG
MLGTKLSKSLLRTTPKYIEWLAKIGVKTVWDLISHFPRDFDDRTQILDSFSYINLKEKNTILVKLVSVNTQRTANNKLLVKAIVEDKDEIMAEAVWFNQKFLAGSLKPLEWKQIILTGKVKYAYWKLDFMSPDVEKDLSKMQWEILPIYPELNYIPSKWIHSKMKFLDKFFNEIPENLPKEIIEKYNFISRKKAYHILHFPKNKVELETAKKRLAYEELFHIQKHWIDKKYELIKNSWNNAFSIKLSSDFIKEILEKLPFVLTDKQKISLFQILKDMEQGHASNRLLEWDVWTWKTIVALIAAIHAIKQTQKTWEKIQVAVMAPTAILASQHFESMKKMLDEYNLKSELLIWATTLKNKEKIKDDLVVWKIDVIIWTHALIEDDVIFNNLWFVIIDEQHRFWVKQREKLELKFSKIWKELKYPHILNMTATPIPRTLALTLYGDQDLSIIDEYPKGRKEIITKVVSSDSARNQVELFIKNELEKWRQVFWISPLVEKSEKMDLADAINTYDSLVEIFAPFNVWLIHWKLKQKEKDEIMSNFGENKIQVLSATSVIEVWIDVPNASVIAIEWAERFGLSQLHQFRWRVGRWEYQSYCYLFPSKGHKTDRLKAMERTNNWFELAEIDLEIRGPWEVYWVKQAWVPDLKLADLKDLTMVSQIRDDLEELYKNKKFDF